MNNRRGTKMFLRKSASIFLFLVIAILYEIDTVKADQANHLVINEIQVDSIVGAGGSSDDWVELYNPTEFDIVLDGWSIQKQSSTAISAVYKKTLNGSIKAKGYYLVVRGDSATSQALKDTADILTAGTFSISDDNVIYLVNNDINIESKFDEDIVDYVGLGDSESFEGLNSAPNPGEGKSISRKIDGDDSDDNQMDFIILDTPTPKNSKTVPGLDLGGTILVSIAPDALPVQNIGSVSAEIVFSVNSSGMAKLKYGQLLAYNLFSSEEEVIPNTEVRMVLTNLSCDTVYHYSIYAQNIGNTDNSETPDSTFKTLPCGIRLDLLKMTKSQARANNSYLDGWAWDFDVTIWNMNEVSLKMKFANWSGPAILNTASNMQFSINGIDWRDIDASGAYPSLGIDVSNTDLDVSSAGRQLKIKVRMKVPIGSLAGFYNSSYGILTE